VNGGRAAADVGMNTPSPFTGRAGVGAVAVPLRAATVISVEREWSDEAVYDMEIDGAHSFVTEICAVHNCGSGATAYDQRGLPPKEWEYRDGNKVHV
jgi:hypothetical protein